MFKKILKLIFLKTKLVIVFICLILVLVQSALVVNDYRLKSAYPNKTSALTFSSEPFSIVVCFPIYEENDIILNNENLAHIENLTELVFNKGIDDIKINYGFGEIYFTRKFQKKHL